MIVAGEDVRDAEPDEARRSADPRGVERDRSRIARKDHRPAIFAGRHITHRDLEIISKLSTGGRADSEHRARRADRIGDPGIDVALVDINAGAALERRGNVACGLLVALEGTIRRQRQSSRRVRCNQRPVIFEERDVLLDRSERSLDCRRRFVDVDFYVIDRKLGRLEQVQRHADDELGLARFDLDERIDDRVKLEFVRKHDLRACGSKGKQTPCRELQAAKFHFTPCKRANRACRYMKHSRANRRRRQLTRVCELTSRAAGGFRFRLHLASVVAIAVAFAVAVVALDVRELLHTASVDRLAGVDVTLRIDRVAVQERELGTGLMSWLT
jgi:hypothetical protein